MGEGDAARSKKFGKWSYYNKSIYWIIAKKEEKKELALSTYYTPVLSSLQVSDGFPLAETPWEATTAPFTMFTSRFGHFSVPFVQKSVVFPSPRGPSSCSDGCALRPCCLPASAPWPSLALQHDLRSHSSLCSACPLGSPFHSDPRTSQQPVGHLLPSTLDMPTS